MHVIISVLLVAAFVVVGCAGQEQRPPRELVTQVQTGEVKVPVPVPCLKAADVPTLPGTALRRDGDLRQLAAGAAADVYALADYARIADALLRSCAAP